MRSPFNEAYYERGLETGLSCYTNYRWLPELTIPMAAELAKQLKIKEDDTILDFGCAKGFLVKAFCLLHYDAFGVDVSDYAIKQAPEDIRGRLKLLTNGKIPLSKGPFNWIIAKDVLEHIDNDVLGSVLAELRQACKSILVIVPLGEKGKYVIPDYELDKTHKIREGLQWWEERLCKAKFSVTQASYKMRYIKENWSKWPTGNGFFVARSS